ncbi:DUF3828 domain-containing protein [Brevundimonas staleyi]|uniref:DUF3828 domain-containing protein n=1 Tax=Brevundimonas staleyi TaxID=74326 RepID=A0ABW0FQA2_9CAUL
MLAALMVAAALTGQTAPAPTDCPIAPETWAGSEAERGVHCFLGWLYGSGTLEIVTPLGDERGLVFTPALIAMMDRARAAGDDATAFDADPICQCQDPGDLRLLTITVLAADQDRAVARVVFDFAGKYAAIAPKEDQTVSLILPLERHGGEWRIDDVIPLQAWSFRRGLRTP